jgi:metallo-beta-lactamase family protein
MNISFFGAARTVTGSKHLISFGKGKHVLLDCGMFQGHGQDSDEWNRHFGFDPASINYLILSHAHIDHSGLIPKLVKDGFKGPIYCTSATKDLCSIMLEDSARIQESDVRFINKRRVAQGKEQLKPLYSVDDAKVCLKQFVPVDYNEEIEIAEDLKLKFTDAGHILGSAVVNLQVFEDHYWHKIAFTGDLGRLSPKIIRSPQAFPQCDILIAESTYGDRLHTEDSQTLEELLTLVVETCVIKRGKLIIPAFSVGRTQEIVYALDTLENQGRLPRIKVFVDSPLSTNATEIIRNHPECFNDSVLEYMQNDPDPFGFNKLTYLREAEQSKKLNALKEPCIIISASGMAEAGRIKHHIANNVSNPDNTILIVGHCEAESLGARLARGDDEVRIFGELHAVKATVEVMGAFSAHGDYEEMLHVLSCQNAEKVKRVFVVHGELASQQAYQIKLIQAGFKHVDIPVKGETFTI